MTSRIIDEFYPHAFADSLKDLHDQKVDGIAQLDEITLSTLIDLLRILPQKISVSSEGWNPCK